MEGEFSMMDWLLFDPITGFAVCFCVVFFSVGAVLSVSRTFP